MPNSSYLSLIAAAENLSSTGAAQFTPGWTIAQRHQRLWSA
ncbi:MAG: hypothetical protein V5B44_19680 [Candidatus Accumulibacter necessarius]